MQTIPALSVAVVPVQNDSWPELVRRYFALAATAAMVKSTEASGGLDTALGALVGATPLSLLGPFAVLQSLTAGAHTGEPGDAGAARLPLVSPSPASATMLWGPNDCAEALHDKQCNCVVVVRPMWRSQAELQQIRAGKVPSGMSPRER